MLVPVRAGLCPRRARAWPLCSARCADLCWSRHALTLTRVCAQVLTVGATFGCAHPIGATTPWCARPASTPCAISSSAFMWLGGVARRCDLGLSG
eukprot:5539101-Prymnesium_polylepis.1